MDSILRYLNVHMTVPLDSLSSTSLLRRYERLDGVLVNATIIKPKRTCRNYSLGRDSTPPERTPRAKSTTSGDREDFSNAIT
jgi:hypothetical protein